MLWRLLFDPKTSPWMGRLARWWQEPQEHAPGPFDETDPPFTREELIAINLAGHDGFLY